MTQLKHSEMKIISDHLVEAINHEGLHTREVAKILNTNPVYITWAKNEKYWSDISAETRDKITRWHNSRCPLSEYKFPEDEPVWQPVVKEKKEDQPKPPELPVLKTESPDPKTEKKAVKKTIKKTIKVKKGKPAVSSGDEIADLRQKVKFLEEEIYTVNEMKKQLEGLVINDNLICAISETINTIDKSIRELNKHIFILHDETIPDIIQRLANLEKAAKPTGIIRVDKEEKKKAPALVIFSKIIYQ
jgi:hypothetical protein